MKREKIVKRTYDLIEVSEGKKSLEGIETSKGRVAPLLKNKSQKERNPWKGLKLVQCTPNSARTSAGQKERNPWKGLKRVVTPVPPVSTLRSEGKKSLEGIETEKLFGVPHCGFIGQKERNPWKGLKPMDSSPLGLIARGGQKERNPWKGLKPSKVAYTAWFYPSVRRKEIPGRD